MLLLQICMGAAAFLLATTIGDAPWPGPVSQAGATYQWRISPNTASEAELRLLPGVGTKRSRSIMEARTSNGLFTAERPLVDVPGLGPGRIRSWIESGLLDVPAGATGVRIEP